PTIPSVLTAAPPFASSPAKRRGSTGRRTSLTSRMRESFGGILAGWEGPRRSAFMHNQTAPPSLNHSRAQTAENSGHSTQAHSRMPSGGNEEQLDLVQVAAKLHDPKNDTDVKTLLTQQRSTSTNTADNSPQVPKGSRRLSHTIGALGVVEEEIPERRSSEPDQKAQCLAEDSIGCSPSAPVSRRSSVSKTRPVKPFAELAPGPDAVPALGKASIKPADPAADSLSATENFPDWYSSRRRTGGPGSSRTHSRRASISRPLGPGSRGHSRQGSLTGSVIRLRLPLAGSTHAAESGSESKGLSETEGGSGRRESVSSNISVREGSIHSNINAGLAAEPLEVTVNARGSFSKLGPSHPSVPGYIGAGGDDTSILSHVSEKLAELSMRSSTKSLTPK
ncbi:hypothetical protein EC988_007420, partial [Linderina pennispora]